MMLSKFRGKLGLFWKVVPFVQKGFMLMGKNWNQFYAWMLNYQERHNSIKKIIARNRGRSGKDLSLYDLTRAEHHLGLLQREGLQPNHKLLDFGCGFGRSAKTLVPYLDKGLFVGIDLSKERIRMAKEYMEVENLQDKDPQFFVSPTDNDFSFLGTKTFDFIWSRTVLAHMPFEDVRVCLKNLRPLLKQDGKIVIDYLFADEFSVECLKDYKFPRAAMRDMVESIGYVYNEIEDWEYDVDPEHRRTDTIMMRLTLKPNNEM